MDLKGITQTPLAPLRDSVTATIKSPVESSVQSVAHLPSLGIIEADPSALKSEIIEASKPNDPSAMHNSTEGSMESAMANAIESPVIPQISQTTMPANERSAGEEDLPSPPTEEEKYCYVTQNKELFYLFATLSTICLITGMSLFALCHPLFYIFLPYVLLIAFHLGISHWIGCASPSFDAHEHQKIVEETSPLLKAATNQPSVDIYLPNCGEDLEILENTFRSVRDIEWENVKVYVLDDRGREEVRQLTDAYEFHYLCRPNRGELKKAGNLRYAFERTQGEFLVIFDADFAPRSDFLQELMPYMLRDGRAAIVQSPQFFEVLKHQPGVQKGAACVQELFYRMIQVSRNHWGASVCVGTNAVYRRAALEPFGGTAAIAHSEDLHTGFNVLTAGWKVIYLPINLAKGLCPDHLPSFFIQQYRWCMGSTSLLFSLRFWRARLPLMTRLCYLSGMLYYLATAFGVFLAPLPGLVMTWFLPERVVWYNWLLVVPSFLLGLLYTPFWAKAPFGIWGHQSRIISYYAHVFALFDRLRRVAVPWVPTNSQDAQRCVPHYANFRKILLIWSLTTLLLAIGGACYQMDGWWDVDFYPVLFFSFCNSALSLQILRDRS
jgi:cellulose synthase/poly-beta-1,6-N-acetylglucosamine synthase-like glycosyltransferase